MKCQDFFFVPTVFHTSQCSSAVGTKKQQLRSRYVSLYLQMANIAFANNTSVSSRRSGRLDPSIQELSQERSSVVHVNRGQGQWILRFHPRAGLERLVLGLHNRGIHLLQARHPKGVSLLLPLLLPLRPSRLFFIAPLYAKLVLLLLMFRTISCFLLSQHRFCRVQNFIPVGLWQRRSSLW